MNKKLIVFIMVLLVMGLALISLGCEAEEAVVEPEEEVEEPEEAVEEPEEIYTLMFNHVITADEPYGQGFEMWAENVYERTNGGLVVEVFHDAQLGLEEDILEQMREGANVGQSTDFARMGMYVEEMAVGNAPYFLSEPEQAVLLNDSPTMQGWVQELEDEYGFKLLPFGWVMGMRHVVTNVPITHPDDLSGLRIRTPGIPIWIEATRSLGAEPVGVPWPEVYTEMQQGTIDGAAMTYANVLGMNLHELVDYMNETGHIMLMNFGAISAEWFNNLPAEYQEILEEENLNAAIWATAQNFENAEGDRQRLIDEFGMTMVEVDVEAFMESGNQAYEALDLVDARMKIYEDLGIDAP